MTTWRREIEQAMRARGEEWGGVISQTLTEDELDTPFNAGYGGEEGKPFTVWTTDRVYFPVCYDGSEWCLSVARNPDGRPTEHIGG